MGGQGQRVLESSVKGGRQAAAAGLRGEWGEPWRPFPAGVQPPHTLSTHWPLERETVGRPACRHPA